jgi:hypothetical protein
MMLDAINPVTGQRQYKGGEYETRNCAVLTKCSSDLKHFTQYEDLYKFLLSNKGCRKTDTLKKILSKETSL